MKALLKHAAIYFVAFAFLALAAVFSTACGTARGIGSDVGHLGDGIQRAAR